MNIPGVAALAAASIELFAAFIIVGYVIAACVQIFRGRPPESARSILAEGVLTALSLEVAGTLLKTITLYSWTSLGVFAVVFGLRVFLKHVFAAEAMQSRGGFRPTL